LPKDINPSHWDVTYDVPKPWVFKHPWHQHFVVLPVTIHGKRHWMTTVWRRQIEVFGDAKFEPPRYEYGNMFDVIKDDK
jgi:hypothetical protein